MCVHVCISCDAVLCTYTNLIGDDLSQVELLVSAVCEGVSENSGHKDGSHRHESIGSEGLDGQQLVECLPNRGWRETDRPTFDNRQLLDRSQKG